VRASCAVPLLLQPVRLGGRLLVDGGVSIEAPLRALIERAGLERAIVHIGSWERLGGPPPIDRGLKRAIAWARARGVRVHVARTVYPRLEPERLERAPEAVARGERSGRALVETLDRHVTAR
jgi:predicted acylesterase/phospholipase RssA